MTGAIKLIERPTTYFPDPDGATAAGPPESRGLDRDQVRILVARSDGIRHRAFRDLAAELEPGDLVVVNNSATVAGEVDATLASEPGRPSRSAEGERDVVLHAATRLDAETWVIELRTAPHASRAVLDAHAGDVVEMGVGPVVRLELLGGYPADDSSPTGAGNRLWRARATGDLRGHLDRYGRPIAYGYLDRRYPLTSYQSVFSTVPGSAEMPSAGRPFTDALLTRLVAKGVGVAPITLHTGVSSQVAGEAPQPEWYDVSASTARLVAHTVGQGGRVVAVGTTVTRALEAAYDATGLVTGSSGWTDRVVTPEHPPRVVTGLITGWHDPQASHLLLVEAVAGPALTQQAYDAAVAEGYRWHEFGDSALLLPDRS